MEPVVRRMQKWGSGMGVRVESWTGRAVIGAVLSFLVVSCSQDTGSSAAKPAQPLPSIAESPQLGDATLPTSVPALPRANTAREVVVLLRKRVDAGDAQATCQLAKELEFCAGAEANRHRLGMIAERINADQVAALNRNDILQTLTELAKVRGEYCEGMPALSSPESIAMWRRAAMRGHLPSMLQYGSGLAFPQDRLLDVLDELKVFRREGLDLTRRVAQSGNLQANLMLARAYAPRNSGPNRTPLLRQAVRPDAAQALGYYLLAQQLQRSVASPGITTLGLQTETRSLQLMMSPDEVAEGERRFVELQGRLVPTPAAQFDPVAQSDLDSRLAVPDTALCERDEFLQQG